MKYVEELRHLDGVKGNMVVLEKEYADIATLLEPKPITQVIFSNSHTIVEKNRYFFENLWNRALPAKQKIKEIEAGIAPEKTSESRNQNTNSGYPRILRNHKSASREKRRNDRGDTKECSLDSPDSPMTYWMFQE